MIELCLWMLNATVIHPEGPLPHTRARALALLPCESLSSQNKRPHRHRSHMHPEIHAKGHGASCRSNCAWLSLCAADLACPPHIYVTGPLATEDVQGGWMRPGPGCLQRCAAEEGHVCIQECLPSSCIIRINTKRLVCFGRLIIFGVCLPCPVHFCRSLDDLQRSINDSCCAQSIPGKTCWWVECCLASASSALDFILCRSLRATAGKKTDGRLHRRHTCDSDSHTCCLRRYSHGCPLPNGTHHHL